ncbi:MAG: hypothetical protein HQK84_10585, partial [Nitrospinae bacterium]|nr:hypothetical protein [Nitrospinota bacterium]
MFTFHLGKTGLRLGVLMLSSALFFNLTIISNFFEIPDASAKEQQEEQKLEMKGKLNDLKEKENKKLKNKHKKESKKKHKDKKKKNKKLKNKQKKESKKKLKDK